MKRFVFGFGSLLGLGLLIAGAMAADAPKADAPKADAPQPKPTKVEIPKEFLDKVTKALPEKASAKPAAKRKLLACIKSVGYRHDSIPVCAKALELMGNKTGAWETVISDDLDYFEPENLKQFDAVFFCVTTGEIFGDGPTEKVGVKMARLRKSLADFVASGKGIGGNHGAADANYTWPEWGEMMGAYFTQHPFGNIMVKNDDPKSPVNSAFDGKGFKFSDEMYVFGAKPQKNAKQTYSRDKVHVLLSIDAEASKLNGKPRDDQDYAISWIKSYEKGRVFYCSFGHGRDIYGHPFILQHFQDGVQYILGDLKADATPSGKLSASTGTKEPTEKKDATDKKAATEPKKDTTDKKAATTPKKDTTDKKAATEPKKDTTEKKAPADKKDVADKAKPADKTAADKKDGADVKKDATEKKEMVHAAGKAAEGKLVIRVHCGGKEDYKDLTGVVWSADQMYSKEKKWGANGGSTAARENMTIEGTDAPGLYLSERFNLQNYRFDVPNGKYTVRVHLCETWEGASKPGVRSFGVKIQNNVVLKDFNLVSESGFKKPYIKEVKDVEVTDGKIIVEFIHPAVHQHPLVNAIEVIGQ